MPVIGTAGHVDHGKTALIAALTGMDTDRLPEEKARGMTTDLGFAHFESGGIQIGVIDVPGHERYIRNMVAGASGVDGAMLVIAADDGWMEQTRRHAAVLAALGVPIIALVITKSAIVSPGRPRLVAKEAEARLGEIGATGAMGATGQTRRSPPWIAVDSLSGEGIAELRALLAVGIRDLEAVSEDRRSGKAPIGLIPFFGAVPAFAPARLAPKRSEGAPFLHVDRSFILSGTGQVVAGSLRGGRLGAGDELELLPSGEKLRVRGLQRYGEPVAVADPGSRVAITFARTGASIGRGNCLAAAGSGHFAARSLYLALDPGSRGFRPRAGVSLELATGTIHCDARVWPSRTGGFLRLAPELSVAVAFGQAVMLLQKGGAELLASGSAFLIGGHEAGERRKIEEALALAQGDLPDTVLAKADFDLGAAACLRFKDCIVAPRSGERAGEWIFSETSWKSAVRTVVAAAGEPGGFPEQGIAGRLGIPLEAAVSLIGRLAAEKIIIVNNKQVVPAAEAGAPALPKPLAELARRLEAAGSEGLDLGPEAAAGAKNALGVLCRAGRAISLDGRLFLSPEAYQAFVQALVGHRPAGSRLGVGEAKAATGLSRKWILPLLNRMERDGRVRRSGDDRIVLGSEAGRD
ncbi:MAG TPA: SelB C-terminal domain-containing protein [Rectinemataceae bacterium]|nr:SelB C-terminal domain-containing protein [Rectinemataceae bacterium]